MHQRKATLAIQKKLSSNCSKELSVTSCGSIDLTSRWDPAAEARQNSLEQSPEDRKYKPTGQSKASAARQQRLHGLASMAARRRRLINIIHAQKSRIPATSNPLA